jgi:hypothetical protein
MLTRRCRCHLKSRGANHPKQGLQGMNAPKSTSIWTPPTFIQLAITASTANTHAVVKELPLEVAPGGVVSAHGVSTVHTSGDGVAHGLPTVALNDAAAPADETSTAAVAPSLSTLNPTCNDEVKLSTSKLDCCGSHERLSEDCALRRSECRVANVSTPEPYQ